MNILVDSIKWKTAEYEDKILKKINKMLTINLRTIVKKILATIPGVISIYLIRSYSRGEGSVLVSGSEIKLMSDLDVMVLSREKDSIIQAKGRKLASLRTTPLPNMEIMEGHPFVEIIIMNDCEFEKSKPSLFNYELKTAKCIYGNDVICNLPNIKEISIKEVFRVLFDRIFAILSELSPDLYRKDSNYINKRRLSFETAKLICACRDSILILNGIYFQTETERQEYIVQNRSSMLLSEIDRVQDLLDMTNKAYRYRLNPDTVFENNIFMYGKNAVTLTLETVKIFLERLFNMSKNISWTCIIRHLIHQEFYSFDDAINLFLMQLKKGRLITKIRYQYNSILAAMLLLLLSFQGESVDEKVLEEAYRIIGFDKKILKDDKEALWNNLREIVVEKYSPPFPRTQSIFNNIMTEIIAILTN